MRGLLSMKGSDWAIFHIFLGTFWSAGRNFRGLFLYMDIFSTTIGEIWLKFGEKLPST
jgi:hypothetical protein